MSQWFILFFLLISPNRICLAWANYHFHCKSIFHFLEKTLKLYCVVNTGVYICIACSDWWKLNYYYIISLFFFLTFPDFFKKIINEMYGMIICKFHFNLILKIIVYGNIITILCLMWDAQICGCPTDFFREVDRYGHPL